MTKWRAWVLYATSNCFVLLVGWLNNWREKAGNGRNINSSIDLCTLRYVVIAENTHGFIYRHDPCHKMKTGELNANTANKQHSFSQRCLAWYSDRHSHLSSSVVQCPLNQNWCSIVTLFKAQKLLSGRTIMYERLKSSVHVIA